MKKCINGSHIVLFLGLFLFFIMVYMAYYLNEYQKSLLKRREIPSSRKSDDSSKEKMLLAKDELTEEFETMIEYSVPMEIATFYYPRSSFMLEDITMLKLWTRITYAMGYHPKILSTSDLPKDQSFHSFVEKIAQLPSLDKEETRDSKYLRWLAFSQNAEGITCDYRTIYAISSPVAENLLSKESFNGEQLVLFRGLDVAIGSNAAYKGFAKEIMKYEVDFRVDNSNGKAHASINNIAQKSKNVAILERSLPIHSYSDEDQSNYEKTIADGALLVHDRAQLETLARFVQRVGGNIRFVKNTLEDKAVKELFREFDCAKLATAWKGMTKKQEKEFQCKVTSGEYDEKSFNIWILNSDEVESELPDAVVNSGKVYIGFRDALIHTRLVFEYQFGLLLPQFSLLHDDSLLEVAPKASRSVNGVIDMMLARIPVISAIEKRIDEVNVFK